MPLRDHFRPPLDTKRQWESFHASWPVMLVTRLVRALPSRYIAAPRVHVGGAIEIDVAAFEEDGASPSSLSESQSNGGAAKALWAPPQPTLAVETDLPSLDEYEVRIYDDKHGRTLVAAVELVSPANKDRPEHRRAFVAKCHALLQNQVCVVIVDFVTTRHFNLYSELMEGIGRRGPGLGTQPSDLYATVCRTRRGEETSLLESWVHALTLGEALPTVPLWLTNDLAVPLELEESYEETCRILRIP